ncbi:unnamed protein product [Aureobasidium uvarum]|uniref:TauD/TfdA-like domain-containing protein n=1 Tax=Aureobasidium uvarum TaxID=2773716 RepID=A0A9N8PRX5_9PEZI|nr:unnamed protein product [Aureobasidium uvarum]
MAPALIETPQDSERIYVKDQVQEGYKEAFAQGPKTTNYDNELKGVGKHPPAKYPLYLPVWDNEKDIGGKYPPNEPFEAYEHGRDADPSFKNLFKGATSVEDLTANIGAEVKGIQLSKLDKAGKDELALFVAQKKVVEAQDFAEYFGPSHIHPASGAPEGFPKVHLIHRSAADTTAKDFFEERTNSITWHSDVTYEQQPPGTTFLYILDGPSAGGDTCFVNQAEAYRRLSPEFQKRLHGLKAIHSAHEQAQNALARGSIVRRDPVANAHPVVRTHPATGEKALFVNQQFVRRIAGFKKEESDYLLKFLYDHIAYSQDIQARVKWAAGTVIVWDNRVTAHNGQRRHLARLTPQAEAPYETPFEAPSQ